MEMGMMKAFNERSYCVQTPQQSCKNCKYSCNGGFITNPLECEHPIELRKAIEFGIRVVVSPYGICDEYKHDSYTKGTVGEYETDSC
jgi:hypothetical protein